jgi:hypothetical protein
MRLIYFLLSLGQLVLAALLFGPSLHKRSGFRWALVAVLLISGLGWLWLGTRDLLGAEASQASRGVEALEKRLVEQGALLGLVEGGELQILAPANSAGGAARLTQISMVEAVGPTSREIDLQPYEGTILIVRGHDGGGWIYEAEIVEEGGPLLTSIVRRVYRSAP